MAKDRTFADYRRTLRSLTGAQDLARQAEASVPSPKFVWDDAANRWRVAPFPGITVITPPFCDDPVNHRLYVALADIQQDLLQRLDRSDVGVLPVSSFHLTVADLLAGQAYETYTASPPAQERLFQQFAALFAAQPVDDTLRLRVSGLSAYGTAVTVVLAFDTAGGYAAIQRLRAAIYNVDPAIRQQAPFMAHISLFYKQPRTAGAREALAAALTTMNDRIDWASLPPFLLHSAEVRYFPDMSRYVREPHWPRHRLTGDRSTAALWQDTLGFGEDAGHDSR